MKVAGIKGIRVIMGAAKDERAQFSATLNLKSILASYCREQTSTGILHWKRDPEAWEYFHMPHCLI